MKTILRLFVLLITFNMSAQFDVTSGEKTEETITIEKIDYNVMKTSKGSAYIICNSPRTKNDYAVWIGEATEKKAKNHEGKQVRKSKSGKYFVFLISKNGGKPYCKYLKDDQVI